MFHVGGWFDTYLRGTLHCYKDFASRSAHRQQLLIGPWTHLPWCRKAGSVDFGPEAANPVDRLQVRWFDQMLKGINTGLLQEPPVCLFEMGSNRWRNFNSWPSNNQKSYYLSSTGLASIREEGKLSEIPAQACPPDVIIHDPWRPVPALGGHAAVPAGAFERSHLDCRSDVLTYTTELLEADLHLAGDIAIEIWCSADTPSHDLCAVLSQVCPEGDVYNLAQGYIHVASSQKQLYLPLQATCACIAKGNALRLSLSAACFPAYPVNPGTGSPLGSTRLMDAQIVTLVVNCGGNYSSQVLLPIVSP